MEAGHFNAKNRIVTDLDAILRSGGMVKLHGREHEIRPVLVEEFFAFANALAYIKEIERAEKVTINELIDAYYGLIMPICPTITKDDIGKCSQAQVAALMQLVQSHVTGGLTDEKKKMIQNPAQLN